ncbi:MAG: hypothetical protein IJN46_10045 [Lachnospiraceae bacterium]|nr:hypothetical protein [Lachnospiraceae bacterium]
MVNQDKVRLITKVECYRQSEKRDALWTNRYSRFAYVSQKVIKSWIFCTAGTLLMVVLWAVCNSEWLLSIYDMDELTEVARNVLVVYVSAMVITGVISWRTYRRRYKQARISVKKYYVMLRKLYDYYQKTGKNLVGDDTLDRKEGEQ